MTPPTRHLLLVSILAVAIAPASCTLAARIDTCDPPAHADFQVDALTSGDQYPTHGRSLAALPSGLFVAVWASEPNTTDGSPSDVRAALFQADGQIVAPCGSVGGDQAISLATNEQVGRPTVAVGTMPGQPIFIAWRAAPSGVPLSMSQGVIRVRLMRQDLCPWNTPPLDTQIFVASDASQNAGAPVIAARADGQTAIVAWSVDPAVTGMPTLIRSRPISVRSLNTGQIERNPCDGLDAPCTNATVHVPGATPTIIAFQTGYALAYSDERADGQPGFDVRVQVLDTFGVPGMIGRGHQSFGDAGPIDLAAAADATGIVVAETAHLGQSATHTAPDELNVYVERFGADAQPIGMPVIANTRTDGDRQQPAVAIAPQGAVLVAWTTRGAGGMSAELDGRVFGRDLTPWFTGMACDTTEFAISSQGGRSFAPSIRIVGNTATTLFASTATAPSGTDVFGLSVHARSLELARLVPSLR